MRANFTLLVLLALVLACGKEPRPPTLSESPTLHNLTLENETMAWTSYREDKKSVRGQGYVFPPLGNMSLLPLALLLQTDGKVLTAGHNSADIVVTRFLANGSTDSTFGVRGSRTIDFNGVDTPTNLSLTPDGKILVSGYDENTFYALARFCTNGALDTSFHSDGKVNFSIVDTISGAASVVQPDGKTVVGAVITDGGYWNIGLVRLNTNGLFDTSFNTRGFLNQDLGGFSAILSDIALQTDGAILAGFSGDSTMVVARFTSNGRFDTSFSSDGESSAITSTSSAESILLETTGKIVAVGYNVTAIQLVRYTTNGSLDTTFSTDGEAARAVNPNGITRAALQADQKIIVTDAASNNFGMNRFNTNGTLDTTFGTTGSVTNALGSGAEVESPYGVVAQSNGNLLQVGAFYTGSDIQTGFVRLTSNGTLDTSFFSDGSNVATWGQNSIIHSIFVTSQHIVAGGFSCNLSDCNFAVARFFVLTGALDTSFATIGLVETNVSGADAAFCALAQTDGKYVLVGQNGTPDFAAIRYATDGSLDTSFHSDGKVTINFTASDSAKGCTIQSDGSILLAGENGTDMAVARITSNGGVDTAFDLDGRITVNISGTDDANATFIQTDGKIILVGNQGTNDFALVRLNSNGGLDTTFDLDGRVSTNISGNDIAHAALQQDSNIVVTGNQGSGNVVIARYRSNGALDTTFATIGRMIFDVSGSDLAKAILGVAGGKILVGGEDGNGRVFVSRVLSSGNLDTTFKTNGTLIRSYEGRGDNVLSLAQDPTGGIFAGGGATDELGKTFYLFKIAP